MRSASRRSSNRALPFERQVGIPLTYSGARLAIAFRVDLLVDRFLLVEVKSVGSLAAVHIAQVLTYLRLMNLPLGLLINFNVPVLRAGIKRVVNGSGLDIRAASHDR